MTLSTDHITAVEYDRVSERYKIYYEWDYVEEIKVALPVFTGNIKANGKLSTSRTLRHVSKTTRRHTGSHDVEVSREQGKAICRKLLDSGLVSREPEYLLDKLILRVKKQEN